MTTPVSQGRSGSSNAGVIRSGRWRRWGAGLGLSVVGLIAVSLGLREGFTSLYPGGNDLYPRWAAGCAWLERGQDPYSREATLAIQEGIYGRPAFPDEDQTAFAYPAYTVLLTWPLCLTRDFATAHAFAMTALIAAIVLTAAAARKVVGLPLSRVGWGWILACIVLLYPHIRGLLLGQLALAVSLIQVAVLLALKKDRDLLAGMGLALSTIKPQMALLFVPWILAYAAFRRRWGVVGAFLVGLTLLAALPMIWLPTWPSDWIAQLRAYTGYTEFGSLTWILTTYLLRTPPPVEWILTAALGLWMAAEILRSRKLPFREALWPASLSLVLTHFVSPRTATTHFGSLLVPFFLILEPWVRHAPVRAERVLAILMPALVVLSWGLFLATVMGRQESAWNYLPIPILLLAGLALRRREWMGGREGEAG